LDRPQTAFHFHALRLISGYSVNPKDERRENYRHRRQIPTRWRDNDVYHHINNVIYYEFFDTVINGYLMEAGGLDFSGGDQVGFAVETHCQFLKPLQFPDVVDACLRVGKLGKSSVRYEIGIFKQGDEAPAAVGYFVHVFVDRLTGKPMRINGTLRAAMEALRV
jgi:acyl-CoA thioester hydrolase